MNLIACTLPALKTLGPLKRPLSCWLHFEPGSAFDENAWVPLLLALGSRHFAVSGQDAERHHDAIDEIVFDSDELILTTWHSGPLLEIAGEFLAVDCPGEEDCQRLVVCVADDEHTSVAGLVNMMAAIAGLG